MYTQLYGFSVYLAHIFGVLKCLAGKRIDFLLIGQAVKYWSQNVCKI